MVSEDTLAEEGEIVLWKSLGGVPLLRADILTVRSRSCSGYNSTEFDDANLLGESVSVQEWSGLGMICRNGDKSGGNDGTTEVMGVDSTVTTMMMLSSSKSFLVRTNESSRAFMAGFASTSFRVIRSFHVIVVFTFPCSAFSVVLLAAFNVVYDVMEWSVL